MSLSPARKVLHSILAVTLFFGIAELGCRLLLPRTPDSASAPASTMLQKLPNNHSLPLQPNRTERFLSSPAQTFTYNRDGLRNPKVPEPKESAEFRILTLGDSSVLGYGVHQHETFSFQLQQLLQKELPHHTINVINGGLAGLSSTQCLEILQRIGLAYHPDLVLAYVMNSDQILVEDPEPAVPRSLQSLSAFIRKHSCFASLLQFAIRRLRSIAQTTTADQPALKPRVPISRYRRNLIRIVNLGKQHQFKTVFIQPLLPSDVEPDQAVIDAFLSYQQILLRQRNNGELNAYLRDSAIDELKHGKIQNGPNQIWEEIQLSEGEIEIRITEKWKQLHEFIVPNSPYQNIVHLAPHYRNAMNQVSRTHSIPVVNLALEINRLGIPLDLEELFLDEVHPSAYGHRIIAEILLRFLRRTNCCPATAPVTGETFDMKR